MPVGANVAVFLVAALISLGASVVLVSRLERVGARLGLSEALLGVLAALAADAPEITAAVTALAHHERAIGAGVVIGSNVFNLAALLGLGAVVAGKIRLHRNAVALGGAVSLWIALVCLAVITGIIDPPVALFLALVVLVPYLGVLAAHRGDLRRLPVPRPWRKWLSSAIREEEAELAVAIHPKRGKGRDTLEALTAVVVVVVASVTMERAAAALGQHFAVAGIVVGGLILAAVTSLPNAVSAVYLANRGRGAAVLSTALTSNNLNVVLGLLIPAVVVGLTGSSRETIIITSWYLGLTFVSLLLAYRDRGIRRWAGWVIIVSYAAFVVVLVVTS